MYGTDLAYGPIRTWRTSPQKAASLSALRYRSRCTQILSTTTPSTVPARSSPFSLQSRCEIKLFLPT
eukprot:1066812-Rhodomonas_salina.2